MDATTPPPTPVRAATPPTPMQTDALVVDVSTDALVVDVSELSTWEQAVVAATTNDAATLRALLTEEPGLRTLRVTAEDVSHLSSTSGVQVTQGRLLIECALERDHEDVVMLCLEEEAAPATTTSHVRRAVSETGPGLLADVLRNHLAEHLVVEAQGAPLAGLPRLQLPASDRRTFVLPEELVRLEVAERSAACGLLVEASDVLPQVDSAIGWWNLAVAAALGMGAEAAAATPLQGWGLHALYTSSDGNCLLHACLLAGFGVRDKRISSPPEPGATADADEPRPRRWLRAALHHALVQCAPLRALLEAHGAALEGAEGLLSRSEAHGRSLDAAHVLALAHVLGRPIVVLAPRDVEFRDALGNATAAAAAGLRMSGVYLPHLLPAAECTREPLLVCYTRGHFSALVTTEAAAGDATWRALGLPALAGVRAAPVPLTTEDLEPLPVLFPPVSPHETGALLAAYVDTATAQLGTQSVPVALQPCPLRTSGAGTLPSHSYFNADWGQRIRALACAV